ncbi:hypothetical protein [Corallococcus sp. 4LFB]|uniref:hypothetical protein n=1 Tax=Corallococcus sp. 4LFB TaxID=3383249 RepID=UPI003974DF4C
MPAIDLTKLTPAELMARAARETGRAWTGSCAAVALPPAARRSTRCRWTLLR